jgi:hypothetical protein
MKHFWAVLVFVAGCTAPIGVAQPDTARLSNTVLTLTLTDGTVCRANWVAAGGAGRFENCGPGYGYAVRVIDNPNILRQIFTSLTHALGADGAVAPLAEVTITDPAGSDRVFVSPPDLDD